MIPIRGPVTYGNAGAGEDPDRDRTTSDVSFSVNPIPMAWVSLPGPLQSSPAPRRERIAARPSSGSSARISTAAPTSSGSHTALSSAWMP